MCKVFCCGGIFWSLFRVLLFFWSIIWLVLCFCRRVLCFGRFFFRFGFLVRMIFCVVWSMLGFSLFVFLRVIGWVFIGGFLSFFILMVGIGSGIRRWF